MAVNLLGSIRGRQAAVYLGLALAAMLLLTRPWLPTWYDENYTLGFFVDRGPGVILFDYHLPNNHVLYSLLLWGWRSLFGDNLVLSRMLSLILTALALPGLYLAGRALGDVRIGVVAAVFLALSHIVTAFASQLRGYGFSIGLVSLMLGFAMQWVADDARRMRYGLGYAVAGGLAIATIPSNVLFAFAIGVWLIIAGRPWRRSRPLFTFVLIAAPLAGFLAYAGMWSQFRTALSNARDISSYPDFIGLMLRQVFVADAPWALPLIAFGLWRARSNFHACLGLACMMAGLLVIPAFTTVPFDRNLVPVVVFVSLLSAVGLVSLSDALARQQAALAMPVIVVFALGIGREFALDHLQAGRLAQAPGRAQNLIDQYYRERNYNAPAIANFLRKQNQPTLIVANDQAAMDVAWFFVPNPDVDTCITARRTRGCAMHIGSIKPTTTLAVATSTGEAEATLSAAGAIGEYRLELVFDDGGRYRIWRVIGVGPGGR